MKNGVRALVKVERLASEIAEELDQVRQDLAELRSETQRSSAQSASAETIAISAVRDIDSARSELRFASCREVDELRSEISVALSRSINAEAIAIKSSEGVPSEVNLTRVIAKLSPMESELSRLRAELDSVKAELTHVQSSLAEDTQDPDELD